MSPLIRCLSSVTLLPSDVDLGPQVHEKPPPPLHPPLCPLPGVLPQEALTLGQVRVTGLPGG